MYVATAEEAFGPKARQLKHMWVELEHSKNEMERLLFEAREEGMMEGMMRMDELKSQEAATKENERLAAEAEGRKERELKLEGYYKELCDDLEGRFYTPATLAYGDECNDLRAAVLACYRANADKPLRCGDVVRDFAACADKTQTRFLDGVASKGA